MTFDQDAVLDLVAAFCRARRVDLETRIRVIPNLFSAFDVIALKGPDPRWRTITTRRRDDEMPSAPDTYVHRLAERAVYEHAKGSYDGRLEPVPREGWWLSHMIVSGSHWARLSQTMRQARDLGLGWIIPANKDILVVPRPILRCLEERPDVLHQDTGKMAAEWADGTGFHFLRGTAFGAELYRRVIGAELSVDQIAGLGNSDQRSIALGYMASDRMIASSRARLLHVGVKGTRLYRLRLPSRIAHDRVHGYGDYDYFIHMRDASHPEREFIEWVDPLIGERQDAELCQAVAFGITLQEWLSIEQEG